MKEAELIAIFDEDKVYLVGNKSINNLKSVILEGLLFTGTYEIDKGNYRTIDIATKTVKHLVTNYKKNIKDEYEKYKNNPRWLEEKKVEDNKLHYKCKFILEILEKKSMLQGNILMSDIDIFLNELFTQVRYSLYREHNFNEKQVNVFLDETIRLAFNILSDHYVEQRMKKIDYFIENIIGKEEKIPNGIQKVYLINASNRDTYVVGTFKDNKLINGTKNVIDLCTGQFYELEVLDGKETGRGRRITNEGLMICGEVKEEKDEKRIIYPNGDIYIGKQKEYCYNIVKNSEKEDNFCIGKVRNYNKEENVIIFNNGDIYMGQIKDDKKEGYGRVIYSNGEFYVGEFKNDRRNGAGVFVNLNGEKYIGNFKNDEIV